MKVLNDSEEVLKDNVMLCDKQRLKDGKNNGKIKDVSPNTLCVHILLNSLKGFYPKMRSSLLLVFPHWKV